MAVTVQIGDSLATCKDWQWSSTDKQLEKKLSGLLDPRGPTGADPWPDATAAQAAIAKYGGKIVGTSNRPEPVPGRIY